MIIKVYALDKSLVTMEVSTDDKLLQYIMC